jgi:hypothetical protein
VDLSEVVIKWELQRIKDQQVSVSVHGVLPSSPVSSLWDQSVKLDVCLFLSRIQKWTQIPLEKASILCRPPSREACRWTLPRK